jgi:hypothetical protein
MSKWKQGPLKVNFPPFLGGVRPSTQTSALFFQLSKSCIHSSTSTKIISLTVRQEVSIWICYAHSIWICYTTCDWSALTLAWFPRCRPITGRVANSYTVTSENLLSYCQWNWLSGSRRETFSMISSHYCIFVIISLWDPCMSIRVRIDSPHPLVCRKRWLNVAVLKMRLKKPRPRVTAGVA